MPLVAILIDILTMGGYFIQLNHGGPLLYLAGLVFQTVLTVLLLILMIGYHGKRHTGYRPEGYSYLTIRYGIIVLPSLLMGLYYFYMG